MITFWIIASLLILIPIAVILNSVLGKINPSNSDIEDKADLYHQRLAEIESDIENGILSKTDAEKVRKETETALLDNENKSNDNKYSTTHTVSAKNTALIICFFLPVFAISLYHYLGEPGLIKQSTLLAEFKNADTDKEKNESIDKLLTQLEERLIKNPDDVNSWMMLTNSYSALERYPDALRAVENVYRLEPDDFTVQLRYAEILSRTENTFKGKATELINEALNHSPNNPNALWLAGMAANEREDFQQVINYWERLLPQMEDESGPKEQLQSMINSLKTNLGQSITETNIINNESTAEEVKLVINVSLAPALEEQVSPDDTLFVYAKAIDGPPMPLAIIKITAEDLPLQVTLDNSSAMIPTNKLSNYEQVQVIARISKSGNAIQQSGDLIGIIEKIYTNQNKILDLVIYDKIE